MGQDLTWPSDGCHNGAWRRRRRDADAPAHRNGRQPRDLGSEKGTLAALAISARFILLAVSRCRPLSLGLTNRACGREGIKSQDPGAVGRARDGAAGEASLRRVLLGGGPWLPAGFNLLIARRICNHDGIVSARGLGDWSFLPMPEPARCYGRGLGSRSSSAAMMPLWLT